MTKEQRAIDLLLVDDEVEFLDSTATPLKRRGFSVSTAQDGETALGLLGMRHFDVVFLDVKMPGMDGVDVFRQIKHLVPDVPVVLLTGHGSVQQAFETSKEGVFEYLAKPCEVERIADVASRAARRSALQRKNDFGQLLETEEEVRLLFVDDEAELLESLTAGLEKRGIRVTQAASGAEALRQLDRQVFDVALLDVKMPGIDGIALLKRIRAAHPLTEILILTGHPSMGTAVEGLREGAAEILMKPQSTDNLVRKIRAAFRLRQMRVEQQRTQQVKEILEKKPD